MYSFLGNHEVNSLYFGIFASILAFASGNIIVFILFITAVTILPFSLFVLLFFKS